MTHHCGCHQPPVTWTGSLTCHCSQCGLTFSGVEGFDYHQVGQRCRTKHELRSKGYREVRPAVLGRPKSTGTPRNDRSRQHNGRFA